MLKKQNTIKRLLPKKAIAEWQQNIQYQPSEIQIYYLATYIPVTAPLIAIALNIPLNKAKHAIFILQAQNCLCAVNGKYHSILAIPKHKPIERTDFAEIAEQKWRKRPVSIPVSTRIRDLPQINLALAVLGEKK